MGLINRSLCYLVLPGAACLSGHSSQAQELTLDEVMDMLQFADEEEEPMRRPPEVTIEEIVVTAEQTWFNLRNQIEFARENFYADYNELNTIDEFDVHCEDPRWTHTRLSEDLCLPEFFTEAMADEAQMGFLTGDIFFTSIQGLATQHSARFDELRENILRVANENPDVAESLMELGKLEEALRLKREACMEQEAFLGIFRLCR